MTNNSDKTITSITQQLTHKQRLQYEIIDIDQDLNRFASSHPMARGLTDRIRNTLGRCTHIMDGCDVAEFCNPYNDGNGGRLE